MNLRASLEHYLNRVWYGNRQPPWFLRMLVPVYRFLANRRQARATEASPPCSDLQVPIIVVGNLTVGGTGKTPMVVGLIERLQGEGIRAGLISRGYRSQAERSGAIVRLDESSTARAVGDEPLMVYRRTGIPVAVGVDRMAAASAISDRVDVIISDDGLQHHGLPRSMEIVVVDQQRGFGNGFLLPAGPLREPLDRLQSVDHVVEHGRGPLSDHADFQMHLELSEARSLDGGEVRALESFHGGPVQVITGIGNPERLIENLRAFGLEPALHALPDHHALSATELESLRQPGVPLLLTEKDAVKLQSDQQTLTENAWVVPARTVFSADFEQVFLDRVRALIRRNRSSDPTS